MARWLSLAFIFVLLFGSSNVSANKFTSHNMMSANESEYYYEINSVLGSWPENSDQRIEVRIYFDTFGPSVLKIVNIKLHLATAFSRNQQYHSEIPDDELGTIEAPGKWFGQYFTFSVPRTNAFLIKFNVKSEFTEVLEFEQNHYQMDEYIELGGVGIVDSTRNTEFDSIQRKSKISNTSFFATIIFIKFFHLRYTARRLRREGY